MAKDMNLLWGSGSPPCWRVMIVLEEKELQGYKHKLLSFEKGEHKSPEVLATNPRGQLPTFRVGKKILNESYAACLFLENNNQGRGNQLIPECPIEQAVVYQRMFEGLSLIQKIADVVYYNMRVPEKERHDSAIKRNKDALRQEALMWEEYLQQNCKYLASKEFSMADAIVYPNIAYFFRNGACERRYPHMARYFYSLKERPSIQKTWPPTWRGTENSNALNDL